MTEDTTEDVCTRGLIRATDRGSPCNHDGEVENNAKGGGTVLVLSLRCATNLGCDFGVWSARSGKIAMDADQVWLSIELSLNGLRRYGNFR